MTTNTNIDYIRKIGSSIHSMSFIIGAGFSKNISDKYFSWAELLKDMIVCKSPLARMAVPI